MSNTVTQLYPVYSDQGDIQPITAVQVVIGTVNTDCTIWTPAAGNHVFVCGMLVSPANATNMLFKSQSPNLGGTVTTTIGSPNVVGSGTLFSKTLKVGDSVNFSGTDILTVQSITDDTHFVATGNAANSSAAGQTYFRQRTIWNPSMAANEGIYSKVQEGYDFATAQSDALVMQASVAIPNLLLHIAEAAIWRFQRT